MVLAITSGEKNEQYNLSPLRVSESNAYGIDYAVYNRTDQRVCMKYVFAHMTMCTVSAERNFPSNCLNKKLL